MTARQALDKIAEMSSSGEVDVSSSASAIKQENSNADALDRFRAEADTAFNAKDYRSVIRANKKMKIQEKYFWFFYFFRKSLFCLDRALTISSECRQLKISRAECLALLGRYPESQELANSLLRKDSK